MSIMKRTMVIARRVAATLAVLAVAALIDGQTPQSFEVASVKPIGPIPPGRGPAGGADGCDGSFPRVDAGRFSVTTTPYALITWAYGYNKTWGCSYVSYGDLLTGGPAWIHSERYEVQAKIPEGAAPYSIDQFMRGDAPGLEKMLQALLAERFKLVVHRETKQVSAYALVPGKGGARLSRPTPEDKRVFGIRREAGANGPVSKLTARRVEMRDFAFLLLLNTRHPVIDRTGLTGEFNFDLEFAPLDADAAADSSAPSLFTAIQQLGLRLETTKAPLEGIVIDSAARPGEN